MDFTNRNDHSDDSDFSDLDEPETPGELLDGGGNDATGRARASVRHTTSHGISVEESRGADQTDSKVGIPFSSIHKARKGFTHIRTECWMNEPIKVIIPHVQREEHPHMTRKAFNPNLYTIKVTHGEYTWTIKRRYKHFDKLHKSLRLFRARYSLPMPTKQHRERRQSIKEDRKERKIKKKQQSKISRFPKKPELLVRESALERRREHLEKYLQSVLESRWYRNHTELLKFLEVSELSFVNRLGQKWREGDVNKCSGGRRISIGCCGCLKKYHVAGRWSKRWLVVKDTFVAYTRPSDGLVCDVMLMDSDFRVESGMSATGAPHGILITNLSRCLLAKCWTSRKADEWEENIQQAIDSTGKEFTRPIRYNSFAPVRDRSYARWFVDGSSYFEAVADALEKAKEEIFITDWWLSPEIYLKRHVTDRERWRLDEILGRKAKAGVKVFVLLYKELEIALTINSHYSKHALMNKCPENIKVIRHPDHVAGGNRVLLWAHHEKLVVIDQKTAFLGGLDLCYGRWDDEKHRMTDLGSVTYSTKPDLNDTQDSFRTADRDIPNNPRYANGIAHRTKERHRKPKVQSVTPHSPIIEMPENSLENLGSEADDESEEIGNKAERVRTTVDINYVKDREFKSEMNDSAESEEIGNKTERVRTTVDINYVKDREFKSEVNDSAESEEIGNKTERVKTTADINSVKDIEFKSEVNDSAEAESFTSDINSGSSNVDVVQRRSVQTPSEIDINVGDIRNNRGSMCSEQEFGSSDLLADHDGLEESEGGYNNFMAEAMVHSSENEYAATNGIHENVADTNLVKQDAAAANGVVKKLNLQYSAGESNDNVVNGIKGFDETDAKTVHSGNDSNKTAQLTRNFSQNSGDTTAEHINGANDKDNVTVSAASQDTAEVVNGVVGNTSEPDVKLCSNTCNTKQTPNDETGKKSLKRAERISESLEPEKENVDLEALEKQIITDTNKLNESSGSEGLETASLLKQNGTKDTEKISSTSCTATMATNDGANNNTDLNRNQTKGSVRFRDETGGTIEEDFIVPTQNIPIEASPRGKKDAAAKRETWASKKLRKTFRLPPKAEKYEEDDNTDGKDSDDEGRDGVRFRNKWRMVLNIKKLEHAGKTAEDEDTMPPESPYSKNTQGHASLSSRLVNKMHSMSLIGARRDSNEDLYYNLYPWKRFWRRDDSGNNVMVKSIMKTHNDDAKELEGLAGSSKLWIGKDYVNFIHKDPVDVHNPFEDFIERDKTARMPWHDIGAVVYGKAARDVARHFIRRWNFCKTEKFKKNKEFPLLLPKSYQKCEVSQAIKDITYEVKSQILRSACGWSAGINSTESSIHSAYIDAIKKAKHYIYIENQFFISQVDDHSLVKNEIAEALVSRIQRAYKNGETFRVYVVLPLLPAFEGEIGENGGYAIQAVLHWNYKSISKGPNSVIAQLQKTVDDPKKYILFCGLRSHCELKGKLVTELVYVHSKLMIVDDDTVIIGSANINDRSMLGSRDSELAVITEDVQKFPVTMGGVEHMAGRYASSLRRTLFREHLGIEETNFDIDLTDPVGDEFYKNVWLCQASINTTIYYKVFRCIPDDHIKKFAELKEVAAASCLAEKDKAEAQRELQKVKGHLVLLPLYFLEFEETISAGGAKKEALMPEKLWL